MQPKIKKIILIAVIAVVAIGVFLFAPFGTQQIGNTVINGNYYDTPLEAYNHADASFDVKEEIATVDITEKSAIWLVYVELFENYNGDCKPAEITEESLQTTKFYKTSEQTKTATEVSVAAFFV